MGLVVTIDCKELTADEKLALAAEISDSTAGKAVALVKGSSIAIDDFSGEAQSLERVAGLVADFLARRAKPDLYSFETMGDTIFIHSPDPIAALHGRRQNQLPDNIKQCPFCGFVTPYDEEYTVHVRAHGFT
ncbi:MAG: hypothetical protein HY297_05130 [Thaumarchaeota archaeon]|nr:hypothetical protein [Nitrososphaerota archaeon]